MTTGIIQQVFNKLYEKQWSNYYHTNDIKLLEQELIEAIKKHLEETETPYHTGLVLGSWLIGGNTN